MNEQVHPLFKDILNSVQNLEKSVDTASKSIWDLIRVDTPANTIDQVKAGTVIKDRDGKTIVAENVLDLYIVFIYNRNTLSLTKESVSALLATGEWSIISGPEPNTIHDNQPEHEIDYFTQIKVGDVFIESSSGVARKVTDKNISSVTTVTDFGTMVVWPRKDFELLFTKHNCFIILELEEQGPSPAEMKEQYIELLKKYNEAETARHNFREKIIDAWANDIVQVWESAPLAATEPGGPLLYDIDSLVIE